QEELAHGRAGRPEMCDAQRSPAKKSTRASGTYASDRSGWDGRTSAYCASRITRARVSENVVIYVPGRSLLNALNRSRCEPTHVLAHVSERRRSEERRVGKEGRTRRGRER